MNALTRGVRNAFRNVTRTVSIVIILGLSIGLSLVMLIARQAVQNKINTTLSSIGNTITIAPPGFDSSSAANATLASAQLDKVKGLKHVTDVMELLNDRLQTIGTVSTPVPVPGQNASANTSLKSNVNTAKIHAFVNGKAATLPSGYSPPVAIVGANEPANPVTIGVSSLTITSGKAIDGNTGAKDAMVGSGLASKNDLHIGSTFTAYGKTLTVSAIFESGTERGDNTIIIPLATEQSLSGQGDTVTEAIATVDSLYNLSNVTTAIKDKLGTSNADVTSSLDQANQAIQPLNSVKRISLYSLIGAVGAGATITLLIMIMIVRERRREIGILKAVGFSNLRIMFQFVSEALTFTVLGSVIGLAAGIFGGNPVTSALVSNSSNGSAGQSNPVLNNITDVHAQVGWTIILYGLGAAVVIAVVGSALASYFISKVRPAEVLRSE